MLLIFLLGALPLVADDEVKKEKETPIRPTKGTSWPWHLGVLFGFNFVSQSGSFSSACICEFEKGGGDGLIIGAFYEKKFARSLAYGIRLTSESRNLTAKRLESEFVTLEGEEDGQSLETSVRFRHEAQTEFSFIALTPYIQWTPFSALNLQLGLSPHFLTSGSIRHEKQLAQRTLRDDNGQILDISLAESLRRTAVVEDGDFPELNSFQMAATGLVSLNIKFSDDFTFQPMFQYVIPFTNISEKGENFKLQVGQLLFGLRKTF